LAEPFLLSIYGDPKARQDKKFSWYLYLEVLSENKIRGKTTTFELRELPFTKRASRLAMGLGMYCGSGRSLGKRLLVLQADTTMQTVH